MNKIYLDKEFDKFWEKIENNENFALSRSADGERAIMLGKSTSAQEGWRSPNKLSKLSYSLLASLDICKDNFYYGISCPCCDTEAYFWYLSRIKTNNITFSNLWVNKNFEQFKQKFVTLNREAVLIANYRAKNHKIGNLNILKHYEINDDCISFWEKNAPKMIENIKKDFGNRDNLLYVVSAGPMSAPIIAELYKNNPNNCYIDFGSAIDVFYRGNITRPYMIKGSRSAKHNDWMFKPDEINTDVSIVLNLYKRPENLKLQLEAIKNQSIKPKEILLYHDGADEIIRIPEEIKQEFDLIESSQENKGVWERFRFAKKNAKSEYVCVIDDDTIPGTRWLENCMREMINQEGLYGTIGIIMEKPKEYPKNNSYFRVGWDGNLDFTTEVDFVGHNWFFKRIWLDDLLQAPDEIQKFKKAGEDMSFSYQLLKKGIKTFVPPHPKKELDLFGSIPKISSKMGNNPVAISYNGQSITDMNNAINILTNLNWRTLSIRNHKYITKIKCKLFYNFLNLISMQITYKHKIFNILGIKIAIKQKY